MSKNRADYELLSDCDLGDDDEFPGEDEMLDDIASALQDFEAYSTGAKTLRVTIVTTLEPADIFRTVVNLGAMVGPIYTLTGLRATETMPATVSVATAGLRLPYTRNQASYHLPFVAE